MGRLHWHALDQQTVLERLDGSGQGLTTRQWRERLDRYGPNALPAGVESTPWRIFFEQFKDFMVMMLLAATGVAALLGEMADAVIIVIIVLLNAGLGTVQEYRAERALRALKDLAAPVARVLREGIPCEVPAEALVPGEVMLLAAGDRVAADGRLLEVHGLEVDESLLTGESVPVLKHTGVLAARVLPAPDRTNMVFMGTVITRGRGQAVVVATGMATEMGAIAGTMAEAGAGETPLQRRLDQLGRWLVLSCALVCGAVVVAGVRRGDSWFHMLLTGVSLAVAAVPEGLPAVVTVALARGVQRMAARSAIVRTLPAVETLGCATLICTDKTGTLTRNEMTVRRVVLAAGARYRVTGTGYDPSGEFCPEAGVGDMPGLTLALTAGALCNDARLVHEAGKRGKGQSWRVSGDPTEGALLVAASKLGLDLGALAREHPRLDEMPFTPERRRMSVVVRHRGGRRAYIKGAPDTVLGMCSWVHAGPTRQALDAGKRRGLAAATEEMAGEGLRVLGLAYRELSPDVSGAVEESAVFLGLVGLWDPPRPEAVPAIARCRRAGIRPVMITGDHPATAAAIARETGLLTAGGRVLTGEQLAALADRARPRHLQEVAVYARVSPQQKLGLVRAFRTQGQVVAMTGDGVNDAPALKEADIGIAMGLSGTDVSKEASGMILADDNFATIVAAIEEGRAIYANIRKFIRYLLSCNVGEVLVMLGTTLAGWPLPLLPMQILWVNLVTDGLPAMALGVEPPEEDIMTQPPRGSDEGVFARGLAAKILVRGVMIAAVTALAFGWSLHSTGDLTRARTLAFVTLVFCQLFHVFECRSERRNIFSLPPLGNAWLILAVACSALMTLGAVVLPVVQPYFQTTQLALQEWLAALVLSSLTLGVAAVRQFFSWGWRWMRRAGT